MTSPEVRILLVDDHEMMRKGLRMLIADQPGMSVVGEAGDRDAALELIKNQPADVIVMDIHLPGINGIETSREILANHPGVKVVALSADPDLTLVNAALQAGVSGYLTKDCGPAELLQAIRSAIDGRIYLSPDVASVVVNDYMRGLGDRRSSSRPHLSEREQHLLRLVAEGKRNKEIAGILNVGVKSVETYRSRLMKKLGCASTVELTRYALREGIASL